MIHVTKVSEFVKNDVVLQVDSQKEQPPVQGYGALGGARTPTALLVAHSNFPDFLSGEFGKIMNSRRQPILSQGAQQREQLFFLWSGRIEAEMELAFCLRRPRHPSRTSI